MFFKLSGGVYRSSHYPCIPPRPISQPMRVWRDHGLAPCPLQKPEDDRLLGPLHFSRTNIFQLFKAMAPAIAGMKALSRVASGYTVDLA